MFGKYLLHELKNTCKLPIIVCAISIGAILTGLLAKLTENFIVTNLGAALCVGAIYAILVIMVLVVIFTYSGRLFNSKGHLTLTMPIKSSTIILAKTLAIRLYFLLFCGLGIALIIIGLSLSFNGNNSNI